MSRNIIRKPAVTRKTGLSHSTIWRLERVDEFPARIRITEAGAIGWYEDEIDAWVHERTRGCGKRPPLADRGGLAMVQNTPAPLTNTGAIHFCIEWREALTREEFDFAASLLSWPWRLTPEQRTELDRLVEKCRDAAAADLA